MSRLKISFFVFATGMVIVAGCTAEEIARTRHGALVVQAATTQPATQAIAQVVPYGNLATVIVGAVAGAIATFAPMFAKTKSAEAAVVEVAQDTAVSLSDEPFSVKTQAILGKLGVDTPGTKPSA